MRIALGSDHAGFDLKTVLAKTLADWGHDTLDLGTDNATDSVDYPDFGAAVGRSVARATVTSASPYADRVSGSQSPPTRFPVYAPRSCTT